ncbi:hypothetical protein B566_EDAN003633 [Ephemera danica]|nr:hypothetical protein B566_EDAN003633 [Ephemera danica]
MYENEALAPPEPAEPLYDWPRNNPNPTLSLECLMPNGLLIPLSVDRNATLLDIKEELFEEASKFPLNWALQDRSTYVFLCVIPGVCKTEHFSDETKRLLEVNPFRGILRLQERKSEKPDDKIENSIQKLIGRANLQELKSSEVTDFRWKTKNLVDNIVRARKERSLIGKMMYMYPPRLAPCSRVLNNVRSRLRDGYFFITAKFEDCETTFKLQVHCECRPSELLGMILNKKSVTSKNTIEQPHDYVLKVCGLQEYLIEERALISFRYIQDSLAQDASPTLITVPLCNVIMETDDMHHRMENLEITSNRTSSSTSTLTLSKKGKYLSAWDITLELNLRILAATQLNCNKGVQVAVAAGLFHGGKPLCATQRTSERQVAADTGKCEWEEDLNFNILVRDVPRNARLCLVVYEVSKVARGTKHRKIKDSKQEQFFNPIAWVNTTVYDFKSQLQSGNMTLYMWNYNEDMQTENDFLHPLGTVVSNPNVQDTTSISIAFQKYDPDRQIIYPAKESILEVADSIMQDGAEVSAMNAALLETLKSIVEEQEQDPLHELHEQECKVIWGLRHTCMKHYPVMLPKVLDCVEWNDRLEVAKAICLLQSWPKLPAEKALELLDYAYADPFVRSFAVSCLEGISDEDLSLYLLQLVQAIKHESYLYCDLVEFLIKRALNNQKIGHYLFWHLRSDMDQPAVSVRFGLILEAYLHGSVQHLPALSRQVEALAKLEFLNEQVRTKPREKQRSSLHEMLTDKNSSGMKPLWIVFENDDMHGDDIYIIYKNGDDLRQDMLTLQMLKIMDRLWKLNGLDFRMNPYNCISTDSKVGLIEVVLNADTIANIQKEKGAFSATCAFRKGSLLDWLKDHNPNEVQLNKAIEEFTFSCAGYCVATYVLGIADRHSDNIMIKKTGQLFHIDFGHILGHFKEKFGFRRERVPFVLTNDFVHVINKGQAKEKAPEFKKFQDLCEQAFMILRKHGSLIISLFAMMISTGLPELSSEKDLNYLQETLVLNKNEKEALQHFRSKFNEALSNSWKTSLNWVSHNIAKNNKQ